MKRLIALIPGPKALKLESEEMVQLVRERLDVIRVHKTLGISGIRHKDLLNDEIDKHKELRNAYEVDIK